MPKKVLTVTPISYGGRQVQLFTGWLITIHALDDRFGKIKPSLEQPCPFDEHSCAPPSELLLTVFLYWYPPEPGAKAASRLFSDAPKNQENRGDFVDITKFPVVSYARILALQSLG
jgi:hypothetical protein